MPQKKDKKQSPVRDQEYQLVYSTDRTALPVNCKGCLRPAAECICKSDQSLDPEALRPRISTERKGRGGKTVTVISRLPPHPAFLDKLLKFLKKKIGSGGTAYTNNGEGVIEIQGEHSGKVLELINKFMSQK